MGTCSNCGQEKDLTLHGTCWKCHVSGVQTKGGCKNCGKHVDEFRVSKDIKTSSSLTFKG